MSFNSEYQPQIRSRPNQHDLMKKQTTSFFKGLGKSKDKTRIRSSSAVPSPSGSGSQSAFNNSPRLSTSTGPQPDDSNVERFVKAASSLDELHAKATTKFNGTPILGDDDELHDPSFVWHTREMMAASSHDGLFERQHRSPLQSHLFDQPNRHRPSFSAGLISHSSSRPGSRSGNDPASVWGVDAFSGLTSYTRSARPSFPTSGLGLQVEGSIFRDEEALLLTSDESDGQDQPNEVRLKSKRGMNRSCFEKNRGQDVASIQVRPKQPVQNRREKFTCEAVKDTPEHLDHEGKFNVDEPRSNQNLDLQNHAHLVDKPSLSAGAAALTNTWRTRGSTVSRGGESSLVENEFTPSERVKPDESIHGRNNKQAAMHQARNSACCHAVATAIQPNAMQHCRDNNNDSDPVSTGGNHGQKTHHHNNGVDSSHAQSDAVLFRASLAIGTKGPSADAEPDATFKSKVAELNQILNAKDNADALQNRTANSKQKFDSNADLAKPAKLVSQLGRPHHTASQHKAIGASTQDNNRIGASTQNSSSAQSVFHAPSSPLLNHDKTFQNSLLLNNQDGFPLIKRLSPNPGKCCPAHPNSRQSANFGGRTLNCDDGVDYKTNGHNHNLDVTKRTASLLDSHWISSGVSTAEASASASSAIARIESHYQRSSIGSLSDIQDSHTPQHAPSKPPCFPLPDCGSAIASTPPLPLSTVRPFSSSSPLSRQTLSSTVNLPTTQHSPNSHWSIQSSHASALHLTADQLIQSHLHATVFNIRPSHHSQVKRSNTWSGSQSTNTTRHRKSTARRVSTKRLLRTQSERRHSVKMGVIGKSKADSSSKGSSATTSRRSSDCLASNSGTSSSHKGSPVACLQLDNWSHGFTGLVDLDRKMRELAVCERLQSSVELGDQSSSHHQHGQKDLSDFHSSHFTSTAGHRQSSSSRKSFTGARRPRSQGGNDQPSNFQTLPRAASALVQFSDLLPPSRKNLSTLTSENASSNTLHTCTFSSPSLPTSSSPVSPSTIATSRFSSDSALTRQISSKLTKRRASAGHATCEPVTMFDTIGSIRLSTIPSANSPFGNYRLMGADEEEQDDNKGPNMYRDAAYSMDHITPVTHQLFGIDAELLTPCTAAAATWADPEAPGYFPAGLANASKDRKRHGGSQRRYTAGAASRLIHSPLTNRLASKAKSTSYPSDLLASQSHTRIQGKPVYLASVTWPNSPESVSSGFQVENDASQFTQMMVSLRGETKALHAKTNKMIPPDSQDTGHSYSHSHDPPSSARYSLRRTAQSLALGMRFTMLRAKKKLAKTASVKVTTSSV